VAEQLHYLYLDSGAMYRAVTLAVYERGKDVSRSEIADIARAAKIEFKRDGSRIYLDGHDVSREIRTEKISKAIAPIAANPLVRKVLVQKQRQLGEKKNLVAEGRDMGTVVFPNANLKIYMQASIESRARRRLLEIEKNDNSKFDDILASIQKRDETDTLRDFGPLKRAVDALVLDTTDLTIEEQVDFVIQEAYIRGAR
jgi:cytidylate kinase